MTKCTNKISANKGRKGRCQLDDHSRLRGSREGRRPESPQHPPKLTVSLMPAGGGFYDLATAPQESCTTQQHTGHRGQGREPSSQAATHRREQNNPRWTPRPSTITDLPAPMRSLLTRSPFPPSREVSRPNKAAAFAMLLAHTTVPFKCQVITWA